MSIDEMIEVLQAAKAGKMIEARYSKTRPFTPAPTPTWDFDTYEYRVKPEGPREWWLSPFSLVAYRTKEVAIEASGDPHPIRVREVLE